jgi:hypothetical protein
MEASELSFYFHMLILPALIFVNITFVAEIREIIMLVCYILC